METRLETLVPPDNASTGTEHELNFLLVRDTSGDWPRWKRAALGSVIFHLVAITALFLIKSGPYEPPPPENLHVPYVVHLYLPKELTQKAPNKGPVAKLMLSQPAAPSPKLNEPAPKVVKAPAPPPPAPVPTPPAPTPVAPPPPAPVAQPAPPASTPPPVPLAKPDAPKIIVEDSLQAHPAPKPGGNLTPPSNSIQEAMRSLANNGPAPTTHLGESSDMSVGAGLHLPASAARFSNFQLKSDPMGVDFQPYLQQVLAEVKLNWAAVFPTAAKLGTRGLVTLEFEIFKNGTVGKVVWDAQSGSRALDNASVAAISASNPLPSLPKDYKGDRIVLQMTFMYNMPK